MARLRCSCAFSETGAVTAIAATAAQEARAWPIARALIFTISSPLTSYRLLRNRVSSSSRPGESMDVFANRTSSLSGAEKNQRAACDHQKHAENFWKLDNSGSFHDHFLRADLNFTLF